MATSGAPPKKKRNLLPLLAGLLLVPPVLAGIWTFSALKVSFSEGERAGYLQKISRKGWVCKTYEGELAMTTLPGAPPERFFFTVSSKDVAAQLEALAGQRVAVRYEQHRGVPTTCFGETEYFVVGVRRVE